MDSYQDPPSQDEVEDMALHTKAAIADVLADLKHGLRLYAAQGTAAQALVRTIVADVHHHACTLLRAFTRRED
jgi:hypothetical protein